MPNHAHFAISPMHTPKDLSSAGTPTTEPPNPFSRPSSPVGQVAPDKKLHMGFIGLGNMGQKMALCVASRRARPALAFVRGECERKG